MKHVQKAYDMDILRFWMWGGSVLVQQRAPPPPFPPLLSAGYLLWWAGSPLHLGASWCCLLTESRALGRGTDFLKEWNSTLSPPSPPSQTPYLDHSQTSGPEAVFNSTETNRLSSTQHSPYPAGSMMPQGIRKCLAMLQEFTSQNLRPLRFSMGNLATF